MKKKEKLKRGGKAERKKQENSTESIMGEPNCRGDRLRVDLLWGSSTVGEPYCGGTYCGGNPAVGEPYCVWAYCVGTYCGGTPSGP